MWYAACAPSTSTTRAGGVRRASDRLDRVDRAQRVRDVRDRDDLRARRRAGARTRPGSSSPESLIGTTRSVAPVSVAQHLPRHDVRVVLHAGDQHLVAGLRRARGRSVCATRLMPSVASRVKTISCAVRGVDEAPRSVPRAPSNRSVARSLRWCTPRWTLALLRRRSSRSAPAAPTRGFCVVAALSRYTSGLPCTCAARIGKSARTAS